MNKPNFELQGSFLETECQILKNFGHLQSILVQEYVLIWARKSQSEKEWDREETGRQVNQTFVKSSSLV